MDILLKKNRTLLKELVKTDFKMRYQGSVLGYLWSVLKPIMLFIIMYIVFVKFLPLGDGIPHYAVALLLAIVLWQFFGEVTGMGMNSVVGQGGLIRKVSFPKTIIILSVTINALINLVINLVVVLGFALVNKCSFHLHALLIIPEIIELVMFSMGVAFILSTLYVKFRDIGPIWEVFMQGAFYGTPIIYPITVILNRQNEWAPILGKVIMLNPMAQIIQDSRYLLTDTSNPTIWSMMNHWYVAIMPIVISVVVFVIGLVVFNKSSKNFAEKV
jgi:ABC-2 type transport system permease protein